MHKSVIEGLVDIAEGAAACGASKCNSQAVVLFLGTLRSNAAISRTRYVDPHRQTLSEQPEQKAPVCEQHATNWAVSIYGPRHHATSSMRRVGAITTLKLHDEALGPSTSYRHSSTTRLAHPLIV